MAMEYLAILFKLLLPASFIMWLFRKNIKQHIFLAIYFIFCIFNNYAVANFVISSYQGDLSADCFIIGFISSMATCAWLSKLDKAPTTYGALIASMLLAGFCSNGLIQWILSLDRVKSCACLDKQILYYPVPLLIGILVTALVPIAITYVNNKWGKNA